MRDQSFPSETALGAIFKAKRTLFCRAVAGLIVLIWPVLTAATAADDELSIDAEGPRFFQQHVLPILSEHCFSCHAEDTAKGGFQLDTRSRLVRGGESGAVIDADTPEQSVFLQAVRYEGYEMPPRGQLPETQIETLRHWLAMGAPYPEDRLGEPDEQRVESPGTRVTEKDRQFWAFQPLTDPPVPTLADNDWGLNAVDAFIATGLSEVGLDPAPVAPPEKLLRRLHYDLTGLPPGGELVQAFLADPSLAHYQQIVDQLLASPAYGERWGRHWLDLVRYAETNGYERDDAKPEVWRYRDYVVDSFNADKPFDQFTHEQLAGDELPYSDQHLIATGFYRLGVWDDEPADPKLALYDDLDDIVATTSQVFLGLTINCARCHEHKIDPVTHADYYRLLAFFNGIERYGVRGFDSVERASLRPLLPPQESLQVTEETHRYRQQMEQLNRQINRVERKLRADLVQVENEEFRHEMNRVALARKRVGTLLDEDEWERYAEDLAARRRLRDNPPRSVARALCVTEIGSQPRPTYLLTRGNPHAEGERIQPGFPEVLGAAQATPEPSAHAGTSGRRTQLARWITDPKSQPLTARVTANRLWQYHFGRGIVSTPNDFGFQGSPPTHPELLDYLASRLLQFDWHLKPVHRLLVLSETYRMDAPFREDAFAVDPTNQTYWRFEPRRLSAEEIRDSMLSVAGLISRTLGGPSVYPVIEAEVLAGQSRPGSGWGNSSPGQLARRSIYIHAKRSLQVPLLATFDVADMDFTCPVRFATTQPTQALGLLNSEFTRQIANAMASDVQRTLPAAGREDVVAEVLRRTTQRVHFSDAEIERGVQFIDNLTTVHNQPEQTAVQLFCLLAINLNEFLFLD